MKDKIIYGIQQVGIGVADASSVFKWYATVLGADVKVFEDFNTAQDMADYMGGQPHDKHAILALNMNGGGGYEIWQFTDRTPQPPSQTIRPGDLGIVISKVKSNNIQTSYNRLKDKGVHILTDILVGDDNLPYFHIKDISGNWVQIKEYDSWYNKRTDLGGLFGVCIGVSDIEESMKLYADVLGYDEVVFDETSAAVDLNILAGTKDQVYRRVLLRHSNDRTGGFSKLFGTSELELIQAKSYAPIRIYANRYWGDLGYIHLCFDIRNMSTLVEECSAKGFPFTVLSDEAFQMGDANGRFGYIEDPDGTLIEFVETHRVPIIPQLNVAINLKKRDPVKPLPNWLIRALALQRVKF